MSIDDAGDSNIRHKYSEWKTVGKETYVTGYEVPSARIIDN